MSQTTLHVVALVGLFLLACFALVQWGSARHYRVEYLLWRRRFNIAEERFRELQGIHRRLVESAWYLELELTTQRARADALTALRNSEVNSILVLEPKVAGRNG